MFHTPVRPSMTGMLFSKGAVRKCSSTLWAPALATRGSAEPIGCLTPQERLPRQQQAQPPDSAPIAPVRGPHIMAYPAGVAGSKWSALQDALLHLHAHRQRARQKGTHEELLHDVKAILQAEWQHADSSADRVSASKPVPEGKGIVWGDTKLLDQLQVGGDRHHVL